MIKKIEALANLAVIITSVVVCTVLVKHFLLPSSKQAAVAATTAALSEVAASSRKRSIEPGTKVSLPGVDWSKSDHSTLVSTLNHLSFLHRKCAVLSKAPERETRQCASGSSLSAAASGQSDLFR